MLKSTNDNIYKACIWHSRALYICFYVILIAKVTRHSELFIRFESDHQRYKP